MATNARPSRRHVPLPRACRYLRRMDWRHKRRCHTSPPVGHSQQKAPSSRNHRSRLSKPRRPEHHENRHNAARRCRKAPQKRKNRYKLPAKARRFPSWRWGPGGWRWEPGKLVPGDPMRGGKSANRLDICHAAGYPRRDRFGVLERPALYLKATACLPGARFRRNLVCRNLACFGRSRGPSVDRRPGDGLGAMRVLGLSDCGEVPQACPSRITMINKGSVEIVLPSVLAALGVVALGLWLSVGRRMEFAPRLPGADGVPSRGDLGRNRPRSRPARLCWAATTRRSRGAGPGSAAPG